jgi:hypothetical protein
MSPHLGEQSIRGAASRPGGAELLRSARPWAPAAGPEAQGLDLGQRVGHGLQHLQGALVLIGAGAAAGAGRLFWATTPP